MTLISLQAYYKPVSLESFKESGGIEYGSDVLIGFQFHLDEWGKNAKAKIENAKRETPRKVELHILKNREGETGTIINYSFNAAYNYFEEVEDFEEDSDFEEYGA